MITIQSDLVGQLRAQTFCVAASDTSVSNKHITTRALFTALMLIFVGIFGASAQVVQPAWITNGLLAYYPFNGNAKDESGNGNNGSVVGVVSTTNRFGIPHSAFQFSGAKPQRITTSPIFQSSGEFTASLWVTVDPGVVRETYLLGSGGNGSRWFGIRYQLFAEATTSNGYITIGPGASAGSLSTPIAYEFTTNSLNWIHVVATVGKGFLAVYINGQFVGQTPAGTISSPPTGNLVIGDFEDPITGHVWNGRIDDVRFYNRALSATEVQALYSYESLPDTQAPRVATASSQVVNGFVVGATIIDGGQGYTNAPRVNFVGGGGSGATATATIDANGSVTAISIRNTGSGYTNSPLVVIDPPPFPPKSAYATATVVNGFVVGVSITNGGYGYGSSPSIHFVGGGGSGASAAANINELGVVTNVTIITVGSGYTNAPEVVIAPPIVPAPALKVGLAQTLTFTGLNNEKTYELQALDGQSFVSTGTTATPQSGTYVTSVDNPAAYRLVVQPVPRTATASLQVVNGFVVGAAVVTGGSGYTAPPAVNIVDGTGSGASVAAVLNSGSVAGFVVNSVGHNYSSNAVAIVVSPPVVGITPTASPSLRMTASHLLPYFAYQLQTSTNLITFQTDGDLIFATNSTQVLYYPIRNSVGFGKLVYVR